MQLTFIGTGDCAGIPVYNCPCTVCNESRTDPNRKRGSCCASLTTTAGRRILIDAGVYDLGERFSPDDIDLILLSHYHIDHVCGLFPMRWGCSARPITIFGPDYPEGCADLLKHPGIFDFSQKLTPLVPKRFGDLEITPLSLNHSKPALGYAISAGEVRLAWLCDTSGLPVATRDYLKEYRPSTMVLDCTFPPLDAPHPNHNDITRAMALHREMSPKTTYLTHIGHELDHWLSASGFILPKGVVIATDGANFEL